MITSCAPGKIPASTACVTITAPSAQPRTGVVVAVDSIRRRDVIGEDRCAHARNELVVLHVCLLILGHVETAADIEHNIVYILFILHLLLMKTEMRLLAFASTDLWLIQCGML